VPNLYDEKIQTRVRVQPRKPANDAQARGGWQSLPFIGRKKILAMGEARKEDLSCHDFRFA